MSNHFALALAAALSITSTGFGQHQMPAIQENQTIIQKLQQLNLSIEQAVLAADVPRLETLYADDFVFTHGSGLVQSKSEWLSGIRSGKSRYLLRELDSMAVELHGNVAIATGKLTVHRPSETGIVKYALNFVRVFVLSGDRWQLISHRTTKQWNL